jgi:hypothetical protein
MASRRNRGWYDFAALMIGLAGVFNGFAGLTALFKKEYFSEASLVYQNLQVWAWIWLVVGVIQLITAAALVNGGGRVMAIVVAAGSAIVTFASIEAKPLWSLVILVADVLVIYHLSTKAAPVAQGETFPGSVAPGPETTPGSIQMH